jgi:hypothetical protein
MQYQRYKKVNPFIDQNSVARRITRIGDLSRLIAYMAETILGKMHFPPAWPLSYLTGC